MRHVTNVLLIAVAALVASAATAAARPSITVTRYAPTVSGNIGVATGGIFVNVSLHRGTTTVADAPVVTTDADGDWQATLPAHTPSSALDSVAIHYSGGGAPVDATFADLGTFDGAASISADGTQLEIDCPFTCGSAIPVAVSYGGAAPVNLQATPQAGSGGLFELTFAQAVGPDDAVTYAPTITLPPDDVAITDATVRLAAPLPGVGSTGDTQDTLPACRADLVTARVDCDNLQNGASYTLRRAGTNVAEAFTASTPSSDGVQGAYAGGAVLAGLQAGDTVELVTGTSGRVLTTLGVAALRADTVQPDGRGGVGSTTGTCPAGAWVAQGGGGHVVCAGDGTFAEPFTDVAPAIENERGAGDTHVALPSIAATSPTDGQNVLTSFTAYTTTLLGDVVEHSPVALRVRKLPDGAEAPLPGDANGDAGVAVGPLATGRYQARWVATDTHGDTATRLTRFVVDPGAVSAQGGPAGPQGPAGPGGAAGPAGSNGKDGAPGRNGQIQLVVCKPVKSKKSKKTTQRCTTQLVDGPVKFTTVARATLTRNNKVYAAGVMVHRRLTLEPRRTLAPGRYVLTLRYREAGKRHVKRRAVTIR